MLPGQSRRRHVMAPLCPTDPPALPITGLASPSDTFSVFYGEKSPWCE